jgi:acetolactate synthase-1/2/3 large subunit
MLIWEDHAYGLIAWKQESQFGRHTDLAFGNPDWLQLADSFGWHSYRVTSSKVFAATLETAFSKSGPSLVVAPVDYSENMKLTQRLGEITQPCPLSS